MGIELNNEQIYCVYDMEHWWNSSTSDQLFQITGPAGTGKSTIVRFLIERLDLSYENVLFTCFCGKGASQLARNGLPAQTIHSAIYNFVKEPMRDENGKIVFKKNNKPVMIPKFVLKEKLKKKIKLIVVDEGSMVDKKTALDLMSFNIPIIVLGDLNQLPPVFGNSYFLVKPDVHLHQIMRQAEGNPIIWLSQEVLSDRPLRYGVYKNSAVISKNDITDLHFRNSDIVLSCTNRLRYNVNTYFRENIKNIKRLDIPHVGEKMICRKNNWNQCIDENLYLTNGTAGFVEYIYKDSFNGKTMTIDFRPDFTKSSFKKITFDYKHLFEVPGQEEDSSYGSFFYDKMEFAYAITVHSAQGSQWNNPLFLFEDMMRNKEDRKKLLYTGITRAIEGITIAL